MRLTVLLGLLANLFVPWGIATELPRRWRSLRRRSSRSWPRSRCSAALLAAAEVFMAKLRLFRVPELLAGSFVLACLAVTASSFLA